ncbi:dihydrodipicolinate synthase family protein [Pararoseomonas sp. SCSIO 73927]|uniref:dihydrodipicolinate synthase family protein n=1 Tax=Pararoseomonas sp. SCSIO 73927 TaxID=3114537 RepID=UPI0030D03704
MDGFPADRPALIRALFPGGVPQLWSPSLFFYDASGGFDRARQEAHFAFMAGHVGGFLIPGSTGDAWEMADDEAIAALDLAIDFARPRGIELLAGVLRPDAAAMGALLERMVKHLCDRAGTASVPRALDACRVRGVTIAPPTTPEPLSQPALAAALEPLLARGLPMALYQLPQVTGNRMAPELLADLAHRFSNFILFKDSGGTDEVALSGLLPAELVTLRGAEGDYARWHSGLGGPYDGFLLSTANAFPARLESILAAVAAGKAEEASAVSGRLSSVVADAFAAVASVADGNAFTNANKLLAHVMAFGTRAPSVQPPALHAGSTLPARCIEQMMPVLEREGMLPEQGYFADHPATG